MKTSHTLRVVVASTMTVMFATQDRASPHVKTCLTAILIADGLPDAGNAGRDRACGVVRIPVRERRIWRMQRLDASTSCAFHTSKYLDIERGGIRHGAGFDCCDRSSVVRRARGAAPHSAFQRLCTDFRATRVGNYRSNRHQTSFTARKIKCCPRSLQPRAARLDHHGAAATCNTPMRSTVCRLDERSLDAASVPAQNCEHASAPTAARVAEPRCYSPHARLWRALRHRLVHLRRRTQCVGIHGQSSEA